MHYLKGQAVLPPELITKIQEYIDGGLVYIPKKESGRAEWGSVSGVRRELNKRNEEIFELHISGISYRELAEQYYLSVDRIKRIVQSQKCIPK